MEEVKLPEPDTASLAYSGHSMDYISGYEAGFESAADQMREAILAERERCAMLVEKTPAEAFCTVMHQAQLQRARETFAAAIRKE